MNIFERLFSVRRPDESPSAFEKDANRDDDFSAQFNNNQADPFDMFKNFDDLMRGHFRQFLWGFGDQDETNQEIPVFFGGDQNFVQPFVFDYIPEKQAKLSPREECFKQEYREPKYNRVPPSSNARLQSPTEFGSSHRPLSAEPSRHDDLSTLIVQPVPHNENIFRYSSSRSVSKRNLPGGRQETTVNQRLSDGTEVTEITRSMGSKSVTNVKTCRQGSCTTTEEFKNLKRQELPQFEAVWHSFGDNGKPQVVSNGFSFSRAFNLGINREKEPVIVEEV